MRNLSLVKVIENVRSKEEIIKDREYKSKHNNEHWMYTGGYSKDTSLHDVIVAVENEDGTIRQIRKILKQNSKGYYVDFDGNRYFLEYKKEEYSK